MIATVLNFVHVYYFQVTRAAVEQYTGEGKPPYCEMTVKATGVKEQHGDLRFYTALKGMETSPIMIEQPYEQSRLELVIEMRGKLCLPDCV